MTYKQESSQSRTQLFTWPKWSYGGRIVSELVCQDGEVGFILPTSTALESTQTLKMYTRQFSDFVWEGKQLTLWPRESEDLTIHSPIRDWRP